MRRRRRWKESAGRSEDRIADPTELAATIQKNFEELGV